LLSSSLATTSFVKSKRNPVTLQQEVQYHYQWVGPFCQGGILEPCWPMATGTLLALLPNRWRIYVQAWSSLAQVSPDTATQWDDQVLQPQYGALNCQFPMQHFIGPGGVAVDLALFSNTRETLVMSQSSPFVPPAWARRYPELDAAPPWIAHWKRLVRLRWKIPDAVDTAHHIALFAFHPGSQTAKAQSPFPNNQYKFCQLCLDPSSLENFEHIFTACHCSGKIWAACTPPSINPPQLRGLVCPLGHLSLNTLALYFMYMDAIWHLVHSRRWSAHRPASAGWCPCQTR